MSHSRQRLLIRRAIMAPMWQDFERCFRAMQAKDQRFDGWFFTGVVTTGIYCRVSCPAVSPRRDHVRFFPSAAAAQEAGLRACKRCRPDASPGSPEWDTRADVVARAMRLLADGVVDREGVAGLARRLAYSPRQLERQLVAELGAGPLSLARAQRAQTARILIETTSLPMSEVAPAAGFASIRQFNETLKAVFGSTPSQLRRPASPCAAGANARNAAGTTAGTVRLRLAHRRPLWAPSTFGHLAATAVPGVEEWRDGTYRRSMALPHGSAIAELTPYPDHVSCRLALDELRDLPAAVSRCRRLLDLDADPAAVDSELSADPALAPAVGHARGARVPRCTDPGELALRVVLGQQVSLAAARTHAARLVRAHGGTVAGASGGVTHHWPSVESLAGLDLSSLALPESRRRAFAGVLASLASGALELDAGCDWNAARATLAALPGIGPWTVETVAMRALGDPDAFPSTDLGVRLAASKLGLPTSPAALAEHAKRWRPWRSYATVYLWSTLCHPVEDRPARS